MTGLRFIIAYSPTKVFGMHGNFSGGSGSNVASFELCNASGKLSKSKFISGINVCGSRSKNGCSTCDSSKILSVATFAPIATVATVAQCKYLHITGTPAN